MKTPLPAGASTARYDRVAQSLHWLVAVLAVIVVKYGLSIAEAPRESVERDTILLLHRSIGIVVFALMLFRLGWRYWHPAPALPPNLRPFEALLARANHAALYVIFLGMPFLGYVNAAAAGHSVSFFGIVAIPPLIPENDRLAQIAIALHLAGQFAVYLFVGTHVAAVLIHLAVRRDGVFSRMLPGRRARRSAL